MIEVKLFFSTSWWLLDYYRGYKRLNVWQTLKDPLHIPFCMMAIENNYEKLKNIDVYFARLNSFKDILEDHSKAVLLVEIKVNLTIDDNIVC